MKLINLRLFTLNFSHRCWGGATSRIRLHNWPRAEAHVLLSSAHRSVRFKIKLASQTRTSPEFRCHRSGFLLVMDQNTRFLLCLSLLTAVLGPLVLGKSRGGVRELLLGLMLGLLTVRQMLCSRGEAQRSGRWDSALLPAGTEVSRGDKVAEARQPSPGR